jgi:hypothetical protein
MKILVKEIESYWRYKLVSGEIEVLQDNRQVTATSYIMYSCKVNTPRFALFVQTFSKTFAALTDQI